MKEIWKDIRGYDGNYQASTSGRIRSFISFKILKPRLSHNGYFRIKLSSRGHDKTFFVHNLILQTFIGDRPQGFDGAHLNGFKTDNRLSNLKWCTKSENQAHRKRHGTRLFGEKHPRAVLSNKIAKQILDRYQPHKTTSTMLAKELGLSISLIQGVLKKNYWKHLKSADY